VRGAFQSISIPQWVQAEGNPRSIINPGRRDACQLRSPRVTRVRFLAATTPVATRRRRRRHPSGACCSPGRGGRRGAASDGVRPDAAGGRPDGRRDASQPPGKLHARDPRAYSRTSCPSMRPWHGGTSDDVFRLTGSSVRRRRDTGVAGRVRHGRCHARRVERRDARAPQSFLRGARRVVPAATTVNTRVFTRVHCKCA
jgi:hypothetical protein